MHGTSVKSGYSLHYSQFCVVRLMIDKVLRTDLRLTYRFVFKGCPLSAIDAICANAARSVVYYMNQMMILLLDQSDMWTKK
jgi:hypothetical protein